MHSSIFAPLYHPGSSLVAVALGPTVCHTVYPFAQPALLVNAHCMGLVQDHTLCHTDFCHTINTGPSQKLLSGVLLLPPSWGSCSSGSVGPIPSCTPAGHRWGGCWGGQVQNPRCGPR